MRGFIHAAIFFSVTAPVSVLASEAPNDIDINQIEERLIEEAYERSQWMIRASHIQLDVSADATPSEHRRAQDALAVIRQAIIDGQDFKAAAKQYSDSPSAQDDGGDMGYFTVFERLYPIETAAFLLAPGEISEPVKTRFGYHLITVTQRIPMPKRKRVAHILIEDPSPNGRIKAQNIFQLLSQTNFNAAVQQYSDDVITKASGGDLGFDRLVNELEGIRLTLNHSQFSRPIKTSRGWHILKVTEEVERESLTAAYKMLNQQIMLDNRTQRILDDIMLPNSVYPVTNSIKSQTVKKD